MVLSWRLCIVISSGSAHLAGARHVAVVADREDVSRAHRRPSFPSVARLLHHETGHIYTYMYPVDGLNQRLVRPSVGRSVVWSFGHSVGRLVGWLVGLSFVRSFGRSVGRSVGRWVESVR